jgi:hypothetical protein
MSHTHGIYSSNAGNIAPLTVPVNNRFNIYFNSQSRNVTDEHSSRAFSFLASYSANPVFARRDLSHNARHPEEFFGDDRWG